MACTAKLFLAVSAVTWRLLLLQTPLPAAAADEAAADDADAADADAADADDADAGVAFGGLAVGVVVDTPIDPESRSCDEGGDGTDVDGLVVVLEVLRDLGWPPPPLSAAHSTRMIPSRGKPTNTSRRRQ